MKCTCKCCKWPLTMRRLGRHPPCRRTLHSQVRVPGVVEGGVEGGGGVVGVDGVEAVGVEVLMH